MDESKRIFFAPPNNNLKMDEGYYCWLENGFMQKWQTSGPFETGDEAVEQLRLIRSVNPVLH